MSSSPISYLVVCCICVVLGAISKAILERLAPEFFGNHPFALLLCIAVAVILTIFTIIFVGTRLFKEK